MKAMSLAFYVVAAVNLVVTLSVGIEPALSILGFLLSAACGYLFVEDVKTKIVHTMQDGDVAYSEHPVKYVVFVLMMLVGYLAAILAPWVIKEH